MSDLEVNHPAAADTGVQARGDAAPAPERRGRRARPQRAAPAEIPPPDWRTVAPTDLANPALYINRELSWLEFNQRVLAQAQDTYHPLIERVKFLGITATNLDDYTRSAESIVISAGSLSDSITLTGVVDALDAQKPCLDEKRADSVPAGRCDGAPWRSALRACRPLRRCDAR